MSSKGFGSFVATLTTVDNKKHEVLVNYLNQQDFADGWRVVLPRPDTTYHKDWLGNVTKEKNTFHYSVHLSQLPPYLWKFLIVDYENGNPYYKNINDRIYSYSITMTQYDTIMRELYDEVFKPCPDIYLVKYLYDKLHNQKFKGWLMIKALDLLN